MVNQDLRGVNVADLMRHGSGAVDARGLVASLIADTSACQCRHLVMPGDWPDLPDLPDLPCPVLSGAARLRAGRSWASLPSADPSGPDAVTAAMLCQKAAVRAWG
ncbi:hypothetical protein AB838_20370 [Rhodobacteraceae bacterium (ex Bugula neritina AB1)]|nr:hypothetical protein AB838_20370 [Rhodobacteraceae bacterium (ex Bugula neritina AB1)]